MIKQDKQKWWERLLSWLFPYDPKKAFQREHRNTNGHYNYRQTDTLHWPDISGFRNAKGL